MLQEQCRRLAYFSLHRLIGSRLPACYREFLHLPSLSVRSLRQRQSHRLEDLMRHAAASVPFYRDRVRSGGSLSLLDFPVVTKDDLRVRFRDFMAPSLARDYDAARRARGYSWLPVQTGGSTGIPTTVIHDRDFRDFNRAARLYTQQMCGFPIGTRYFKLWGSMREIHDAKASLRQRIGSALAGELLVNAFRMGEPEFEACIALVNRSAVDHMMAYSDAVHRLAGYILSQRRAVRPLRSVMACAGTLTGDMRQTISAAFGGARVHNMYGSRDCGAIACECSQGSLHVFENKIRLEVVDRNGEPVPDGERGRFLITLLGNFGFPLLRYEIGDVGAISERACACGFATRILDRLEGRSVEFLVTPEGRFISPACFIHLIGVVHNPGVIRRFQIVQHAADRVVLSLEKGPSACGNELAAAVRNIRRDLQALFGPRMRLKVEMVERIAESASGKFLVSINKTGQVLEP